MLIPNFLSKLLTSLIVAATASGAMAQDWPSKPIRILVPFGAGSPPDVTARVLADKMSRSLGKPVYVENKTGAIGMVAMRELMRNPADGHTLLTMITPLLVASTLLKDQSVDPLRDFAPVGQYTWSYSVLVTSANSEAGSMAQLIDAVRSKPGQFSFASGGHGTPAHLAGELFRQKFNLDAVHAPYNQFPFALADLATGRVNFMFLTSTAAVANVQGGKLRAIGVAADARLDSLPDVPTLAEQGFKDFDIRAWDGFVVRTGTSAEIVQKLNKALNDALDTADVKERWKTLGVDVVKGTPAQFGNLIRRDAEKWVSVVKKANIKVD